MDEARQTAEVIVIPITPDPNTKEINYILNEFGSGNSKSLKFPSGAVKYGETSESAANRILLSETGIEAATAKFMYVLYSSESRTSVYMSLSLDSKNKSGTTITLTGDQLLKKIRENDIADLYSMAALSAVLLQSKEAKKYLIGEADQEEMEK